MSIVKYMFLALLLLSVKVLFGIGVLTYQRVRRNADFWKEGNELSPLVLPAVSSVVLAFVSAVGLDLCILFGVK